MQSEQPCSGGEVERKDSGYANVQNKDTGSCASEIKMIN